jgi:exosortase A-associated hydrolase 2
MSLSPQQAPQVAFNETPFFFPNGAYRLFGILHRPTANVARGRGFVFCYPCFEEKLWAHRVFVSFARELASLGFHVLRFDYMGHGDSDGDFQQSTVVSRLSDIACAVRTLRQEIGNDAGVSLLGLRFGALLAANHAEGDDRIDSLVLWDPVTDGNAYMQEVLLSNLATQSAVYQEIRQTREDLVTQMQAGGTVVIEGYEMTHTLYEEASALQSNRLGNYSGPCLIVQIGRSNQKPKKVFETLSKTYPRAELALCSEELFWKEIRTFYSRASQLAAVTINWVQAHGG